MKIILIFFVFFISSCEPQTNTTQRVDLHLILEYVAIIIGAIGVGYGIYEYYNRQKLSKVFKTYTQAYAGDIAKIHQSCAWGSSNVRAAHKEGLKIADCQEKREVLRLINNATGDAASSARMCSNLFNQLLAFQEAQFGTRDIIHPEKETLELCKFEFGEKNLQ
jgi:hypothetical protein